MKKIIFSLALLLSAISASAQSGKLTVKGELKNIGDSLIIMSSNQKILDKIAISNDKFAFTLDINEPQRLICATPGTLLGKERRMFQLVAVPGESADIKGDIKTRFDITGSDFYQKYHQVDLMEEASQKEFDDYTKSLTARMKAGESRDSIMKEYGEKAPQMEKKMIQTMMNYIKANPNNEACATIISNFYEIKQIEEALGYLSPAVKNGRMKSLCNEPLEKAKKAQAEEMAAKKIQSSGAAATDFTLNDINGKPLTLSSLRGKYVLLDFWGSWCGWCIKGMPQMKEYYAKYKSQMEIIGVDCNDTQEKWKAAVAKHELPWLHVYNEKGDKDVCKLYAISGFPTKILVGPDGKIVKTIVGEDPAFYTFLDETFGKK